MKRALFLVLLLPSLLLASKILNYTVHKSPERVDVMIAFDKPYAGELHKSTENRQITITLADAISTSEKTESIASPLLSKLTALPDKKQTKIIVKVAKSVTMQAAKSADKRQLRLRFSKPAPAASAPVGSVKKVASATAPAATQPVKAVPSKPDETAEEESGGFFYFLIPVLLIFVLITALWLRRQWSTLASGEESSMDIVDRISMALQKVLNPNSKLAMAVVGVFMIMLILPKFNLYYQFEHLIEPYGVILSDEELKDRSFGLDIENATLYVKQIESAKVKKTSLHFFLLYNRIDIKKIALSSTFETFVPTEVEEVTIEYSVLNPLYITVQAVGDFGTAEGEVILTDRRFQMTLQPSKIMKTRYRSTLNKLKKDEAGGYTYESRF